MKLQEKYTFIDPWDLLDPSTIDRENEFRDMKLQKCAKELDANELYAISGPTHLCRYVIDNIPLDQHRWSENKYLSELPRPGCRTLMFCVGLWDDDLCDWYNFEFLRYAEDFVAGCLSRALSPYTFHNIDPKVSTICNANVYRLCALLTKSSNESLKEVIWHLGGASLFQKKICMYLAYPGSGRIFLNHRKTIHCFATFENTWCALDCLLGYRYCRFGNSAGKRWCVRSCNWDDTWR